MPLKNSFLPTEHREVTFTEFKSVVGSSNVSANLDKEARRSRFSRCDRVRLKYWIKKMKVKVMEKRKSENKKIERFVAAIMSKKNIKAHKLLEDVLKEKCAKKIANTLKS